AGRQHFSRVLNERYFRCCEPVSRLLNFATVRFFRLIHDRVILGLSHLRAAFIVIRICASGADREVFSPRAREHYALVRDCANFLRCRLCHPGPGSDAAQPRQIRELARYQDTAMKDAYTWGAILVIVLASSTGDVLLSRAMKQIGDVGKYSRRAGLLAVVS